MSVLEELVIPIWVISHAGPERINYVQHDPNKVVSMTVGALYEAAGLGEQTLEKLTSVLQGALKTDTSLTFKTTGGDPLISLNRLDLDKSLDIHKLLQQFLTLLTSNKINLPADEVKSLIDRLMNIFTEPHDE